MSRHSPFRRIIENSAGGGGSPTPSSLWSVVFAAAVAGDDVTVSAGQTVYYDLATPIHYGCIEINGTVIVDESKTTAIQFDCMEIMSGGIYQCGTEASPYPNGSYTHTITPMGARASDPSVATPASATPDSWRGVMVMPGGEISLIGAVPAVNIVKLAATAAAGASSITLASAVTWKAGTTIEISTTQYNSQNPALNLAKYEQFATSNYGAEQRVVAADVTASTTVTLTVPLSYRHHGQLQYIVPNAYEDVPGTNLSYTQRTIVDTDSFGSVNGNPITGVRVKAAIAGGAGSYLDNRATVGVLTYPIKFGAPNDSDWTTYGYGAHLMVMGLSSKCRLQGVERYRVGQAGFLGRYPDHQHMRSYVSLGSVGSGTLLGDVDPLYNYIKKCSMLGSSNRGSTIHGTCGFTLYQNVYVDTMTHCIFLEDGSERRNVIDGNFVSGVKRLGYGASILKFHDRIFDSYFYGGGTTSLIDRSWIAEDTDLNQQGPSGIWFSSPDNYLRNNIVMGAYTGIWNNFQKKPFGKSVDVVHNGFLTTTLQHFNNEAGCCVYKCMTTLPRVGDEVGTLYGFFHPDDPTGGGYYNDDQTIPSGGATIAQRDLFQSFNGWKSDGGWYGNEAWKPLYDGWRLAGLVGQRNTFHNERLGFFGNGSPLIRNSLACTNTLDDAYPDAAHTQFLSYGSGALGTSNIFVPSEQTAFHIQADEHSQEGGVMSLWDFYLSAIYPPTQNFSGLMSNTAILGKSPGRLGVFLPPPHMFPTFGAAYTAIYNPTVDSTGTGPSTTVLGRMGAVRLPADGSLYGQTGWLVHDSPFLLDGVTGATYAEANTAGTNMSGKLVPASYDFYGIQVQRASNSWHALGLADPDDFAPAIHYTLMQADGITPVTGGTWNTPMFTPHIQSWGNMRHAAFRHGRFVDISWPIKTLPKGQPLPTALKIKISGFTASELAPTNAHFFFSIDWNVSTPITSMYLFTYGRGLVVPTQKTSRALLLSSTTASYYVDSATNKLWVHCVTQPDFYPDVEFRVNDTS